MGYSDETSVTSATVKNVSGEEFSAEAVRIDNVLPDGWFDPTQSTIVFEVPAGIGDFSVELGLNLKGETSSTYGNPPPTATLDASVPAFEVTFEKE